MQIATSIDRKVWGPERIKGNEGPQAAGTGTGVGETLYQLIAPHGKCAVMVTSFEAVIYTRRRCKAAGVYLRYGAVLHLVEFTNFESKCSLRQPLASPSSISL